MKLSLALTLPATIQHELGLLRGSLDDVQWLSAEQNFIPLYAIKRITGRHQLEELDMALTHMRWEPISFALHQVGHQPGGDCDRLTVGITPPHALAPLQKRLTNTLRGAGFPPPRRPLIPEVTIALLGPTRPTQLIPWVQRHNLFHSSEMHANHLSLLEHISTDGAHHVRLLETYPAHPGMIMPDISALADDEYEENALNF